MNLGEDLPQNRPVQQQNVPLSAQGLYNSSELGANDAASRNAAGANLATEDFSLD